MSAENQKNVVINITGMSCNHCAQQIQNALNQANGVSKARVVHPEEKAYIDYDPSVINTDALLKIINDLDFEGTISG